MERVTLRIPKSQLEQVEELVETGEFPNRSEAIRHAVRDLTGIKKENERDTRSRVRSRSSGSDRGRGTLSSD